MLELFTKHLATGISVLKPSSILKNLNITYVTGFCKLPDKFPCIPEKRWSQSVSFGKESRAEKSTESYGSNRKAINYCDRKRQEKKEDLKLDRCFKEFNISMWQYTAHCCGNPCPEIQPRFDTLYYTPTNKATRQYQQTWVECPPCRIRKKNICCYDPTELPPICRRQKAQCSMTAKEAEPQKIKFLCKIGTFTKNPFVKPPYNFGGRYPPKCHVLRDLNLKKKYCPYPSFSECCRECLNPPKNMECLCAKRSPSCVEYRYLKRKILYDLPPPLRAWPPKP